MGAKAVAIDLDNTTVGDASFRLKEPIRRWIQYVRTAGFPVIIVSNTVTPRAWFLSKQMGNIPFIANARKPRTQALCRAAKMLHIHPSEMAMIGDQLFTDVLVANRIGAISVKVEPMGRDRFTPRKYEMIRKRERDYIRKCRVPHGA